MLAEFLNALTKLAGEANNVQLVEHKNLPGEVGVRTGSTVEWKKTPPRSRQHLLRSFSDLLALVDDEGMVSTPEVWYSPTQVDVLLDRANRREVVSMPLEMSERWKTLLSLREGRSFSPPDAVRFLRFSLPNSGDQVAKLLPVLRRINFERSGAGETVAEHGRESWGKKVETKVQQHDQIPEVFDVDVRPYTNPGLEPVKATVQIGVHIDTEKQEIVLKPLADQLDSATNAAQSRVRDLLDAALKYVPVYAGALKLI